MTRLGAGGLRRTGGLAIAAAFAGLAGCVTVGQPFGGLDRWVNSAAHHAAVAHPALLSAARTVTALGGTPVLAPLVVLAVVLLARSDRRRAVDVLALTVGVALMHSLLKVLIGRPRPSFTDPLVHLTSRAFPSGHATTSTVVYGALLLLALPLVRRTAARRLLTLAAAVLVAAIAASRVLLGAHWVTDVVGGLLLGLAWLAIFFPAAAGSAQPTELGQPGASPTPPRAARAQQALQGTLPYPLAITARADRDGTRAAIRRVRLGWHPAGQEWRYEDVSRDQWEITCRACGDDEGPPQRQTPELSLLRGPYIGRSRAQTALREHLITHRQEPSRRSSLAGFRSR